MDEETKERRKNADAVDDGTVKGRVYARLLHVQIDLQEQGDDEGEDHLLDILDLAWKAGLLTNG